MGRREIRGGKPWLPLVALLALSLGAGCAPQTPKAAGPVFGLEHRFPIKVGEQTVNLRLAIHETEREQGLMNVTAMPEDEGMIFVWAQPQRMSFYMRNTRLPLDIGFFDTGGVLREIHAMYPGVEDSILSVTDTMQLALELNQGWFTRHGVKPGVTIDRAALRAALRARGYDPAKYFPEK